MPELARIFISATSADLRSCRQAVKEALLTMGMHPVEQQNFPPDYRNIRDMLRAKIAGCDAVIHIAGFVYGAEPKTRTPEQPRRSYTQMEYDCAVELKKPLYLFVAAEGFPFDPHEEEDEELRALQAAHRAALSKRDEMRLTVRTRDELEQRVRELQCEVDRLRQQVKRSRLMWAIATAAVLVMLAGIGFTLQHLARQNAALKSEGERTRRLLEQVVDTASLAGSFGGSTGDEQWDRALAEVAKKNGMEVEALRRAIDDWRSRIEEDPAADTYDRFLLAMDTGRFQEAGDLALAAAKETVARLEKGEQPVNQLRRRAARQFSLVADAARTQNLSAEAAAAYDRGREFVSKSDDPVFWAELTVLSSFMKLQGAFESVTAGGSPDTNLMASSLREVEEAIQVLPKEEDPGMWAVAQYAYAAHLFAAAMNKPQKMNDPAYLKRILDILAESAVGFETIDVPIGWAGARHFAGEVLEKMRWIVPPEDRLPVMEQMEYAFEGALQVFRPEENLRQWQRAHQFTGESLLERAFHSVPVEAARQLDRALMHLRDASSAMHPEDDLENWGRLQEGICSGAMRLWELIPEGDPSSAGLVRESVGSAQSALSTVDPNSNPRLWAHRQNQFGLALVRMATSLPSSHSRVQLEDALGAFSRALTVFTPDADPENHGVALRNLQRAQDALAGLPPQ